VVEKEAAKVIRSLMDQSGRCERHHISHVRISKPVTQIEHGREPLQVYVAPVGVDPDGGLHDGSELIVGQTQHAAQDIPAPRYNANHAAAAMISARL
jgi:hypothetical protein